MNIDSLTVLAATLGVGLLLSSTGCKVSDDRNGTNSAPSSVNAEPTAASPANPDLPGIVGPDAALIERLRAAVRERGDRYEVRTHHYAEDGSPRFTNRLALELSPYLQQHAHNPVNWFAWGDEAFDRATREDKPVLLSVGYSTCHWCHVMERESFEDIEIARFLNENFIAIKVDREERPDIDDIYMRGVQIMTGRGGWPMTVVMTAEREPFFGGTYFPARDGDRGSRVGFYSILQQLASRYRDERPALVAQAAELSRRIANASAPRPPGDVPGEPALRRLGQALTQSYDSEWGGFGRAPKFPQPSRLLFLLRYHRRFDDEASLAAVVGTLDKMASGGIYDHVGSGFHRYATDREWLVPHFEKMLYDNAQLVMVYLEAYQMTGFQRYATVARDVLAYVAREMTSEEGAFYSATDADSQTAEGHMEEGVYFTWTPRELSQVLGDDGANLIQGVYGVSERGNFEGRSILHLSRDWGDIAAAQGITPGALRERVRPLLARLYRQRESRRPPLRDDKILTAWNGLMIGAFARGAMVLQEPDFAARAGRAAEFILERSRSASGRLRRSYMNGRTRYDAYLDDYAMLSASLQDLYEATGNIRWMREAIRLQAELDQGFADARVGGYYMTGSDQRALLVRDKPTYDGAIPAGNSVAAMNLLRLYEFTGEERYRVQAERIFAAFSRDLERNPMGMPWLASALDYYLDRPREVVIVYGEERASAAQLEAELHRHFLPNRVISVVSEQEVAAHGEILSFVQAKRMIGGRATAYVCERGICQRPTSEAEVLGQQLRASPSAL